MLEKKLYSRFGFPKVILSDNGAQFTSKLWKDHCSSHQIIHHTTAINSARQNPVERSNQQIKTKLIIDLLEKPHNRRDENLHKILFSLRNSMNAATKTCPAKISFGRDIQELNNLNCMAQEEETRYGKNLG
uniref:Uncharacterized protein K02A2.6 n=1 Tax=Cacopsylla melanoneura TaxID=428564 RepID=A0A8D8ZFU3_9HEMI